jgi:hypothetical protein
MADLVSPDGTLPGEGESAQEDGGLQELRDILLRRDRGYLTDTVQEVLAEATAGRVDESKEQMAEALAPVLGQAIRHQIAEAQDDIIDALYPVIGKTIQRSVSEAMRALARRVDEGLRSTFSVAQLSRRLRARLTGVSESDLLLREALPYRVQDVFLIHRASGLLLHHLSLDPARSSDSDVISAMLTAIRDFAQDTFGQQREGGLEEIQYGELAILVEPGPWAYVAVVVEGIAPEDYRHQMRIALSDVHRAYAAVLEEYDGDPAKLVGVEKQLEPLLETVQPQARQAGGARGPWLAVAAASAVLLLCLAAACFGAWQLTWGRPTATPTPTATYTSTPMPTLTPTATWTAVPTATPTSTPPPTSTPTPTASPAPTSTATTTPTPAPFVGVMIGTVWLRAEPRVGSPVTGETVARGQPVEISAVFGDWYLVRFPPSDPGGTQGWVPGQYVGLVAPVPAAIITPTR